MVQRNTVRVIRFNISVRDNLREGGGRSDVTFEPTVGNVASPSEESRKCKAAERCLPSCQQYRFTLTDNRPLRLKQYTDPPQKTAL